MDGPRGRGRGRGRKGTSTQNRSANSGSQSSPGSPALSQDASSNQKPSKTDNRKSDQIFNYGYQPRAYAVPKDQDEKILQPASSSTCDLKLPKGNLQLAKRRGYGTLGRPIELVTNYFTLNLKGSAYHYDIDIISLDQRKKYGKNRKPPQLTAAEAAKVGIPNLEHELNKGVGKLRRKEIFEELININNLFCYNPVYDGVKNVFTSKPLPLQDKKVFCIELERGGKIRKYEITIQPVKKDDGSNKISLEDLRETNEGENEIIMALNSIMNYRSAKSSQMQIGRAFFYLSEGKKINLGDGIEIWFGYNQSIHSTERGAAIVINLAAKAFHKEGPVIEYVNEILGRDITQGEFLKPYELKNVGDAVKGLKVEVTHLPYPRRFTVEGVSKMSAKDMMLDMDGNKTSVASYFESRYSRLRFPYLPCLFMKSSTKQTYIPFEHCRIFKGQPKLGKLSPKLTAKMIRDTAITPVDRFRAIEANSHTVNKESGAMMKSFNLFLNLQNQNVCGRVLDPPSLVYNDSVTINPDHRGVWELKGREKFKSLVKIDCWIILDFAECPKQAIDKLIHILTVAGKKVGLNFGHLIDVRHCNRNVSAEQALKNAEKTKASFAFIILSRRDRFHSYDEIKFIADYQLQFVNQCIDEKILNRFNDQIATNLCLKINAKLGGVNHQLTRSKIFAKPLMIVGADAVHSPRGSKCPSIAAVVASMDAGPFKYKIACRVQENPDGNKQSQELILEMRSMMLSLLNAFYHNTKGHYPEKIIFFRDGVSEGQFQKVYEYEVNAIQEACKEEIGIIVPITFIVVQKRHQTRFRPKNPRDGVGRGGNVPPGTTIDKGITHPHRFDYFLNSHEGIQGTSKSAHYTVLHDDNRFSPDELQQLSYHLCYAYNKCNRSISIPAPVKYADLACYRAKNYADYHIQKEHESSSASSSSSYHLPDHARNAINTMGDLGRHFFFV